MAFIFCKENSHHLSTLKKFHYRVDNSDQLSIAILKVFHHFWTTVIHAFKSAMQPNAAGYNGSPRLQLSWFATTWQQSPECVDYPPICLLAHFKAIF